MSAQAALPLAAPTGQAGGAAPLAVVPPVATPAAEAKPTASILGSTEDPKANGEQGAQGGESKDGKPVQAGELEIKLPDGIVADAKLLAEFKTVAKEAGLSGEAASKLAAWQLQRQQAEAQAQTEAWDKQGDVWAKEFEADPDFGGKNLAKSVLDAKKALRKFGGEPLAHAISALGIGNHPELLKAFSRIGAGLAEDNSGTGTGHKPAVPDEQAKLRQRYPSMFNADGSPKS